MVETPHHLGKKIKLRRIAADIKLVTMAEKTGIPRSVLSRIENRKTSMRVRDLLAICQALDISIVLLLCDSEKWDFEKVIL